MSKQLHLGGFQIASQVTHSHAAWRHPGSGGRDNLTLRDIGKWYAQGVLLPQYVGTATQVADQIEESFKAGEADGFMVSAAQSPGTFNDFVDYVVPELQRRGLFRTEYTGDTLRDHLGLSALPAGKDAGRVAEAVA